MATSSFDTVVRINRRSAKSFEEILNSVNHETIDLHTNAKVQKLNATDLENLIQNKKKISKQTEI